MLPRLRCALASCIVRRSSLALCLVTCAAARAAPPRQITTITTLTATVAGAMVTAVPAGTAVTLTATVTTSSGVPVSPGQVAFCAGNPCTDIHRLGLAQLTTAGVATLKFVPGPGTHSYQASFLGTNVASNAVCSKTSCTFASKSTAVPLTVLAPSGPIKTTVGIQASGQQGDYTLLGTVASNGPAPPTGSVSFLDTTNANYDLGDATLTTTGADGIAFLNTFDYPTPPSSAGVGGAVAAADFNNDGIPDMVVTDAGNNTLSILLGRGDGTFTTSLIPSTASFTPGSIAIGDFNSDGKPDFAITDGIGEGVAIYLGNGDGTFTTGQVLSGAVPGSVLALASADVNQDGIADLIAAETDTVAGGGGVGYIQILLGNNDGTFTTVATRTPLNQVEADDLAIADFNNDSFPDLATTSYNDRSIAVLLNNGDGTFTAAPTISPGVEVFGIAAADLNQDGSADLVVSTESFATLVLLGKGDGTFTQLPADPNLANLADSVAIADFNADGVPDMVLPNIIGGTTNVFLGRGDGTFISDAFSPGASFYIAYSIATADFNGDGQSDIAQLFLDNTGYNTPPNDYLGVLLAQSPSTAASYVYNISPVGTGYHYVDASYTGDSNNAPGVSATVPLLAEQVTTALTLTAKPTAVSFGQPVTLTATLSPFFAQDHYASGNVNFLSAGKSIGTAPVVNGIATLTVTTLTAGKDSIVASYPGDINFTASTSGPVTVTVTTPPPTFTLQLQPAALTLGRGQPGSTQLLLASVNGYTGTLALSYSQLPQYATATLSPASVALTASGTASSTFTLNTLLKTANGPPSRPFNNTPVFFAAAALLLLLPSRRRFHKSFLALLLAALALQSLTGCTTSFYAVEEVSPGTYPITFTATDSGGNSQSAMLAVTITP